MNMFGDMICDLILGLTEKIYVNEVSLVLVIFYLVFFCRDRQHHWG